MNYDWDLEEWSVPLNLTFGRTIKVGKMPLRIELDLNYYVEQYDAFGPDWMVGRTIQGG